MPPSSTKPDERDHFLFVELFKRLDRQDDSLLRIEGQTTRTNGRVTKLEDWSIGTKDLVEKTAVTAAATDKKFEKSKTQVITIITCITLLGATIIGLAVKLANVKIDQGIQAGFAAIEKQYDIKVDNY